MRSPSLGAAVRSGKREYSLCIGVNTMVSRPSSSLSPPLQELLVFLAFLVLSWLPCDFVLGGFWIRMTRSLTKSLLKKYKKKVCRTLQALVSEHDSTSSIRKTPLNLGLSGVFTYMTCSVHSDNTYNNLHKLNKIRSIHTLNMVHGLSTQITYIISSNNIINRYIIYNNYNNVHKLNKICYLVFNTIFLGGVGGRGVGGGGRGGGGEL